MPRPNKPHDELDALLDGRPVELTEELVPLVEVADVLRAELATYELDPEVADRHLEWVLDGSGTVVRMPLRQQANGWDLRRRVAAVVLAAALVLAPATFASAASLPGQAMYPFKLAIEQLRLASVQWSTTREAGERTRVADERIEELGQLVALEMFNHVGPALEAVTRAVQAAEAAVAEARKEGAAPSELKALDSRLSSVQGEALVAVVNVKAALSTLTVQALTGDLADEIQAVADKSQEALDPTDVPPAGIPPIVPTTPAPPVTSPADPQPVPPSTEAPPPSIETTSTKQAPTTTEAPTTTTQTTLPPPTSAPDAPADAQQDTVGGYSPTESILDQPGNQVPTVPEP
jgi:hypothetical protein